MALGDGKVGGQTRDFQLQVGNTVLYNKFGLGVTDLDIQGTEHLLIKEDDCIGIMPRSGATADDIPELRPLGDRVLVKVQAKHACSEAADGRGAEHVHCLQIQESADITAGGVVLPITAREKPVAGTVVRAGPGKRKEDAQERTPPRVRPLPDLRWCEASCCTRQTVFSQAWLHRLSSHRAAPRCQQSCAKLAGLKARACAAGEGGRQNPVLQVGGGPDGDARGCQVRGAARDRYPMQDMRLFAWRLCKQGTLTLRSHC